ncbi:hypothetical protein P5V15_009624 [Pogonomyrmex californicus]
MLARKLAVSREDNGFAFECPFYRFARPMTARQECARSSRCDIKSERPTVTRGIHWVKSKQSCVTYRSDIIEMHCRHFSQRLFMQMMHRCKKNVVYKYCVTSRFQNIIIRRYRRQDIELIRKKDKYGFYKYVYIDVHKVSLNFAKARARIIGPADIYVKTGSLLTLTCLMSQGPHDLGTVAWYRGTQAVVTSPRSENDIDAEPRITVETEWSDALTSRLRITHAKPSDSGNYSCVPTVAERASVNVHVINGKVAAIHPAFIYHSSLTLSRMAYLFTDNLIFTHVVV